MNSNVLQPTHNDPVVFKKMHSLESSLSQSMVKKRKG